MTSHAATGIHAGYQLNTFQTNPFKVVVVEAAVGDNLKKKNMQSNVHVTMTYCMLP